MRSVCFRILKIGISGMLALLILSAFTLFYYHPPVGVPQPERYTNYRYEENKWWTSGIEGGGRGKTDASGYNNAFYPDAETADILFLGSSHLAALQVAENENFVYLLNQKLVSDENPDNNLRAINRGMAGHHFGILASNFSYAAEAYPGIRHMVLEVNDVAWSAEEIDKMLSGAYHEDMQEQGTLYRTIQKIPYLRILSKKISELNTKAEPASEQEETDISVYAEKMNRLLKKLREVSEKNGFETTILFHTRFSVDEEAEYVHDRRILEVFATCCRENGIRFLDVTPVMISDFQNTYRVPYGFSDSQPGAGHLNRHGHALIADLLYQEFKNEREAE